MHSFTTTPAVEVQSWPQVAALALVLLATVTVPAVLTFLGNRHAKAANTKVENVSDAVDVVSRQLQPNGGKSIRDQLNRMEKVLTTHMDSEAEFRAGLEDRLDVLERPPRRGLLGLLR